MNEFKDRPSSPEARRRDVAIATEELDRWLDRLVDGELHAAHQRLLLEKLEDTPGGWRRCALAFLEARAWETALPEILANGETTQPSPSSSKHAVRNRRLFTGIAMAASFLLAFSIGLALREAGNSPNSSPGAFPDKGTATDLVNSGTPNAGTPGAGVGSQGVLAGNQPRWSTMRVWLNEQEGRPQEMELPLVEGPDAEQWVRYSPSGLPAEIVAQLENSGYRVQTQRRLLPVDLDDGRHVIVPVDEVQVVNASWTQP